MKAAEINVLVNESDWAWPEAVRDIFVPLGINALVVRSAAEAMDVLSSCRVHTAIMDIDTKAAAALSTIKLLRNQYPLLPCIMVTAEENESLLGKALELNVFSVLNKPVSMAILKKQLNRLFMRRYECAVFSDMQ